MRIIFFNKKNMKITRAQYNQQFEAVKLQRAFDYAVSYGIYWNIIPTVNIEIAEPFFISDYFFL